MQQPDFVSALRKDFADWRQWLARAVVLAYAGASALAVVGLTWLSDQALRGFAGLLAWQPLLPLLWTPACTAASSRHARPLQPCRRPLACRMLPNGPEGQVQISENQSRECTSRHVAPQVPIVAFDHDHAGAGNLSHRQLGCVVFGMLAVAGSTDSITPRREVA